MSGLSFLITVLGLVYLIGSLSDDQAGKGDGVARYDFSADALYVIGCGVINTYSLCKIKFSLDSGYSSWVSSSLIKTNEPFYKETVIKYIFITLHYWYLIKIK